jgi:NAD(P)-dependent dehydrogenase (short-subunit alcohol dehydrogenase family)
MKDFSGKIAVVTGGGSGMGRELVRQLVAEGCAIAMCDVSSRGKHPIVADNGGATRLWRFDAALTNSALERLESG